MRRSYNRGDWRRSFGLGEPDAPLPFFECDSPYDCSDPYRYMCIKQTDGGTACVPNPDLPELPEQTPTCPPNTHLYLEDGEWYCACDPGYDYNDAGDACIKAGSGTTPGGGGGTTPGGGGGSVTPGGGSGSGTPAVVVKPPDESSAGGDNTWLYLSAAGLFAAGGLYWYSKKKGKKLF